MKRFIFISIYFLLATIAILFATNLLTRAQTVSTSQPTFKYLGKLAADPATCTVSTPVQYWNTATKTFRYCSATNTWADVGGSPFVGNFAKAALPTANIRAGSRAVVTDSTRGIWRYDGTQWVPEDLGRRISALDFCNPATASDCSAGLQTAINTLHALGGGTVVFPAGYTFKFTSLNFNYKYNIIFEGTNTHYYEGSTPNLEYTGAGAGVGINLASSYSIVFRNLHIVAANASYTGTLMKTGRFAPGELETIGLLVSGCVIRGTPSARNSAALLELSNSIIGKVENTRFLYSQKGIYGVRQVGAAQEFSYVYQIENNTFNYVAVGVYNPGNNYRLAGNTFEWYEDPSPTHYTVAIDQQNNPAYYVHAFTFENNYVGDSSSNAASVPPMFRLRFLSGGSIKNNWFYTSAQQTAIQLYSAEGAEIVGNRFEAFAPLSGVTAASVSVHLASELGSVNYGVSVDNNNMNNTTPILASGQIGLSQRGNLKGGAVLPNEMSGGLSLTGYLNPSANFGVDMGNFSTAYGTALPGQIGMNADAPVLPYNSLVIRGSGAGNFPIVLATQGVAQAIAFAPEAVNTTTNRLTIPGTLLRGNEQIYFTNSAPAPLAVTTLYYVRNPVGDTFDISLAPGGAALDITGAASGTLNISGAQERLRVADTGVTASVPFAAPSVAVGTGGTVVTRTKHGRCTLVDGTCTVADATVTANTNVFVQRQIDGDTVGASYSITRVPGDSFTITSKDGSGATNTDDTSVMAYSLVEF